MMNGTTITAEELKERMETDINTFVVDLQDMAQYKKCHIRYSINAPIGLLPEYAKKWDKANEVIIYSDGPLAKEINAKAVSILKDLGFKNIVVYTGNLEEWLRFEFPCEGDGCWVE